MDTVTLDHILLRVLARHQLGPMELGDFGADLLHLCALDKKLGFRHAHRVDHPHCALHCGARQRNLGHHYNNLDIAINQGGMSGNINNKTCVTLSLICIYVWGYVKVHYVSRGSQRRSADGLEPYSLARPKLYI